MLAKNAAYLLTVDLLGIILAIAVVIYCVQDVKKAVHPQVYRNEESQKVMGYIADHPENFYFFTARTSANTETFRIRADGQISNFDFLGGWEFFSPPLTEKFENHRIKDIQQDLLKLNNVLFISEPPDSVEPIIEYYRSINLNVVANDVDKIDIGDNSKKIIVLKLEVAQDSIHRGR